jgi:Replication-relaxation
MTGAHSGSHLHTRPTPKARAVYSDGAGPHRTAGSNGPESASSSWQPPARPVGRDDDPPQPLLLWLLRYPLLRAEDLATTTGYSRQRTYVQLAQLEAAGAIEGVRVPSLGRLSTRLYHVSAVGMQALAHSYGDAVRRAAHAWGADEAGLQRLLPRAPVLVAVQTVVMALIRCIGSASAPSAHAGQPAPQQVGASTEWAWERDYRFALTGQRGRHDPETQPRARSMRLDAYVRLRVRPLAYMASPPWAASAAAGRTENNTSYGLFVVYDDTFLDPGRPQAALRTLLRGRQAHEANGGTMPALLLLVPDARRAQRWQSLNAHMAMEHWLARPLEGGILVTPPPWQIDDRASQQTHTTSERSRSRAVASNPWQANWLSLRDSGSRRLEALLTPAHESTLPALSTAPPTGALRQPGVRRAAKVIGHFNHRAAHWANWAPGRKETGASPTTGGGRSGRGPEPRSEREHLALLALRLDARHSALLALLAEHALLSGEEVAGVTGITSPSAAVYLRYLRWLRLVVPATTLTLADKPPSPPDTPWLHGRYALSPLGIHLVAARSGRTFKRAPHADGRGSPWVDEHAAAYDREVAALMRAPAHTAGVYEFIASLYRAATAATAGGEAQRVVWWETGRACARQYREIDGWHALRPDAAGEYQAGTQRLRFWLEWDRGTMGRRDLETKFAAYAHYVRSREWRTDGNTPLPYLLIVTRDYGQETRLLAALATAFEGGHCALAVRISLRDQLLVRGPIAPIWRGWTPNAIAGQVHLGTPVGLFDHLGVR